MRTVAPQQSFTVFLQRIGVLMGKHLNSADKGSIVKGFDGFCDGEILGEGEGFAVGEGEGVGVGEGEGDGDDVTTEKLRAYSLELPALSVALT